jgi:PAS domain S-box-containing protein
MYTSLLACIALFFLLLAYLLLRHQRIIASQIKRGNERARNILDSSADGIITTDKDGKIRNFNRSAESIFGYRSRNVLGKDFHMLLSEDAGKSVQNLMSARSAELPADKNHNFELKGRRANGEAFVMSLMIVPVRANGSVSFRATVRDINEQKQFEINSRYYKQMMEYLLQASPVVFYACSPTGNLPITFVSPNVEELFGYKPESIMNSAAFWPLHIHPEDRECIEPAEESMRQNDEVRLEYRLKLNDDSYCWVADSRVLVRDESGDPHLLIGSWESIEERKQRELELDLDKERLRIGLRCAELASWDWVINTGEVTWSENMTEQLGFPEALLSDFDHFTTAAHPEDRDGIRDAFRESLVYDQPISYQYRIIWPDKSIHWIHLKGEFVNDDGGSPVRMTGVMEDITAQKQLHEAPRSVAKMQLV